MFQSTVQHLLSEDWIAVVSDELDSNPMGIAFSVEPSVCGMFDAQMGNVCDPYERGYRKLSDLEMYIVAYHDTTALWAQMVAVKNDEVDAQREWYDGELQMLVDGMEDDLWHSRGEW